MQAGRLQTSMHPGFSGNRAHLFMDAHNCAQARRLTADAEETADRGVARWRFGLPDADVTLLPSEVISSWELHEPTVDCHGNDLQ